MEDSSNTTEITHDLNIEQNLPSLVTGTESYDDKVMYIADKEYITSDTFTIFSEKTNEINRAVENFFEQIEYAQGILENSQTRSEKLGEHIRTAQEEYVNAQKAYRELFSPDALKHFELQQDVENYIQEIGNRLESITEQANNKLGEEKLQQMLLPQPNEKDEENIVTDSIETSPIQNRHPNATVNISPVYKPPET